MKRRSRGKTSKTKRQRTIVPAFPQGVATTLPPHWFEETAARLNTVKDLQNFCIAITSPTLNYCNDDRFWKQVFRIRYPDGLMDRWGRNVLSSDAIAQSGLLLLPPHPGRLFWRENYIALLRCSTKWCMMRTFAEFALSRTYNIANVAEKNAMNAELNGRRDDLLAHLPWSRNKTNYWQLDLISDPPGLDTMSWFRAFIPGRAQLVAAAQEALPLDGEEEGVATRGLVTIYSLAAIKIPRRSLIEGFDLWGDVRDHLRKMPFIQYTHPSNTPSRWERELISCEIVTYGVSSETSSDGIANVSITLRLNPDQYSEPPLIYPTGPDPPEIMMQDT